MSRHRFSIDLQVNDELHAGLDRSIDRLGEPPDEWNEDDIVRALEEGIAELVDVTDYECLTAPEAEAAAQ